MPPLLEWLGLQLYLAEVKDFLEVLENGLNVPLLLPLVKISLRTVRWK